MAYWQFRSFIQPPWYEEETHIPPVGQDTTWYNIWESVSITDAKPEMLNFPASREVWTQVDSLVLAVPEVIVTYNHSRWQLSRREIGLNWKVELCNIVMCYDGVLMFVFSPTCRDVCHVQKFSCHGHGNRMSTLSYASSSLPWSGIYTQSDLASRASIEKWRVYVCRYSF